MSARRQRNATVAVAGMPDAPTDGDRRRIRNARRDARARNREIEAARDAAVVEAFRVELGVAVRSASPLLIAMLAIEGVTLDDAVGTLEPMSGWPARPRLSTTTAKSVNAHLMRYYMATRVSQFARRPPAQITERPLVSRMFRRAGGGYVEMQVADHSLEVEVRIGPALIKTRFGELSIELDFDLPATILAGSVGRLVEEIVDHEAWRGRGWRIAATADEDFPLGQRLIVVTGSIDYRMPWMR